jgi:hypothetical protein
VIAVTSYFDMLKQQCRSTELYAGELKRRTIDLTAIPVQSARTLRSKKERNSVDRHSVIDSLFGFRGQVVE